jgi:hypothetical protein
MAVDRPQLAHLKDCVVFSVKGNRPAAGQMSGGDLDGDTCKSSRFDHLLRVITPIFQSLSAGTLILSQLDCQNQRIIPLAGHLLPITGSGRMTGSSILLAIQPL